MATFNELAVLIAEPLGRALDVPFREQLKERIKYWRGKLMRDTLNRNPKDRAFFTQSITIPMEEASAVDCGIPLDCKLMRSKTKLPALVRANNILFDFVGSVDHGNVFKLVKRHELPFFLKAKYQPLVTTYYAYENGYILLPHNRLMEHVTVEAIFADPEEAVEAACGGESGSCSFEDTEYPMPPDLAQQIVQYILQVDFNRPPAGDDKTEVNVNSNEKQ